jgi:hypothetical protein
MSEAREQYRALALSWAAASDDPDMANSLFREHHALYRSMRDSEAGRAAISGFLDDPVPAVRLLAATHSLTWDPERAEDVLERIENEGGVMAMDAKWTLRSHRNANLDLDW